jgi:hypothetical protein
MLFTNECCHAITLVFLFTHFTLIFLKKFPHQRTGYHLVTMICIQHSTARCVCFSIHQIELNYYREGNTQCAVVHQERTDTYIEEAEGRVSGTVRR